MGTTTPRFFYHETFLKNNFHFSTQSANLTVGAICIGIALLAWTKLHETYGKDLNFVE